MKDDASSGCEVVTEWSGYGVGDARKGGRGSVRALVLWRRRLISMILEIWLRMSALAGSLPSVSDHWRLGGAH